MDPNILLFKGKSKNKNHITKVIMSFFMQIGILVRVSQNPDETLGELTEAVTVTSTLGCTVTFLTAPR